MTDKPTLFTLRGSGGGLIQLALGGNAIGNYDVMVGQGVDSNLWNVQAINYLGGEIDLCNQATVDLGVAQLTTAIQQTPGKFAIVGMSQGAIVASEVYKQLLGGSLADRNDDLLAGITFGNPEREGGHTIPGGTDPGGHGIAASDHRLAGTESRWWDFADPNDFFAVVGDDTYGVDVTAAYEFVMLHWVGTGTLAELLTSELSNYSSWSTEIQAQVATVVLALETLVPEALSVVDINDPAVNTFGHLRYHFVYTGLPGNTKSAVQLAIEHLDQLAAPPPGSPGSPGTFKPPTFNHMPPGPASRYAVNMMRLGVDPIIKFITPGGRMVWHLAGGKAPIPGAEPGLALQSLTGMDPPMKLIDLQGARQHGVTNTDMLLDPMELDFVFTANAPLTSAMLPDPNGMRRIMRWWMESWAGNRQGKVSYWTPEMGEWWATVRKHRSLPDQFKVSYAQTGEQLLTWSARGDDSFWWSFDSGSQMVFSGAGDTMGGWLSLTNRGTEVGSPRFLCYGPGYFVIGDGNSGSSVGFGPLLDGQVVLITTQTRLRSVIDLTPGPLPTTPLNPAQQLLADLISFATNNNTPPLLQMFESYFGVTPPQGQLYGLMSGRFSHPVPAIEEAQRPPTVHIPITIQPGTLQSAAYGGPFGLGNLLPPAPGTVINPVAGKTRIVAALTPARVWPE